MIPCQALIFLLISWFNNKYNVCLCCSLPFFPQLFLLDQMVSLFLYFSIELKLSASFDTLYIAYHIGSCPTPCLQGQLQGARDMCSCKPGCVRSSRNPSPFSFKREASVVPPKCKMVIIFLKSLTREESTLSYLGASWPPNGFLVENFMPDTFHCHLWGRMFSLVLVVQE